MDIDLSDYKKFVIEITREVQFDKQVEKTDIQIVIDPRKISIEDAFLHNKPINMKIPVIGNIFEIKVLCYDLVMENSEWDLESTAAVCRFTRTEE